MTKKPVILCVDDDWMGLRAHRILFEERGYKVLVATSGDDGSYKFSAVAPGQYKLLAPGSFGIGPLQSMLDDYADVIETIDLHDGEKVQKDLKRKLTANN